MHLPQLVKISGPGNLMGRLSIDYDKENDVIKGGLSIVDLRTGKVTSSRMLEVPIGKIRDAIIALHAAKSPQVESELAGDMFAMAGFWSDVKKRAKSVAKKVGAKKLMRLATKVMNDPRFAQGLALASMVYPPLGMTVGQIQNVTKLVHAASARDPKAIAKIAAIADAAKKGDTAAQKVASGMIALKSAIDSGGDPVAEVAGWIARKERSAVAMQPITHGPSLRGLYLAAVNR